MSAKKMGDKLINRIQKDRRINNSVLISFIVLVLLGTVNVVQPECRAAIPHHSVSGVLTTTESNLVQHGDVKLSPVGGTPYYASVDANGYYQFDDIPEGLITISPWNSSFDVHFWPPADEFYLDQDITNKNFSISPGVVIYVDGGYYDPDFTGTVAYSSNNHVATFENGNNRAIFYPDDYYLGHTGWVYMYLPFHKFSPQDQGQFTSYDCTNSAISYVAQEQYISTNPDISTLYSYDDPGGAGWAYFPATPDNRMPNNPNVRLIADFNTKGFWPANRISLNYTNPLNDLTDANGHVAEFSYQIPQCGPLNLRIAVKYLYGWGYNWEALTALKESGASDGDLNGDDSIDLSDLAELSPIIGTCEGDPGYNSCADYFPGGCIDLTDVQIFAMILNTDPNKDGGADALQADVWLSGYDNGARSCFLQTEQIWDAAIVRFQLPDIDPSEIIWSPSGSFIDRSILVSNETGDGIIFSLIVLGSGESGTTELGRFSSESSDVLDGVNFISSEIGSIDRSLNKSHSPLPIFPLLGDASPNPFNPMTTISFQLPTKSTVRLVVYDMSGRLVRTLINGEIFGLGRQEIVWDGRNDGDKPVAGGVYFYRLDAGQYSSTKRMTLLK